jgi:hypothetical protein
VEFVESADSSRSTTKDVGSQSAARARVVVVEPSVLARAADSIPSEKAMTNPTRLYDIAHARSGDKGTGANVGVIARSDVAWTFLRGWLTAERVAEFFGSLGVDSVERFELANLQALNFVLRGILKNGLRNDAQGKALGQKLLEMQLPLDAVSSI